MAVNSPPKKQKTKSVQHWKSEYDKKVFLINSMTSLLNRYGTSIELENLYSVFLLTLMGQFVVSDACYYARATKDRMLEPVLVFGRRKKEDLPRLAVESDFVVEMRNGPLSRELGSLPPELINNKQFAALTVPYHVVTPLFLKENLIGILFLGKKISNKDYTQADFDVLSSLCAVSAATFNNALQYRNAKHSAREIQRLHDIRTDVINRITHEFRTPLTIIKGGVELLAADPKYKDLCKLFFDSETRLEDLINSLLSLNEKDVRMESTPVLADPLDTLHGVVHRYTNSRAGKSIQFVLHQAPDVLRAELRIRDEDLRTILNSLLENAVKFSPEKSVVDVNVEISDGPPDLDKDGLRLPEWRSQTEKTIEYYESGYPLGRSLEPALQVKLDTLEAANKTLAREYFVVRISDNGIGIPESDIPLVAEPFRQASNSPDIGVRGSGLGLALAHKTITKHGGYLCCKSAEGKGTIFSVFLPIQPSDV